MTKKFFITKFRDKEISKLNLDEIDEALDLVGENINIYDNELREDLLNRKVELEKKRIKLGNTIWQEEITKMCDNMNKKSAKKFLPEIEIQIMRQINLEKDNETKLHNMELLIKTYFYFANMLRK